MNDEVFRDNSKIVKTRFAIEPEKLGLEAFSKKICWETAQKTHKI